jgi:hypothetical protein
MAKKPKSTTKIYELQTIRRQSICHYTTLAIRNFLKKEDALFAMGNMYEDAILTSRTQVKSNPTIIAEIENGKLNVY